VLDRKIPFAKDVKLGYLTSNPALLGTGMRASICLKLTKLGRNVSLMDSLAERFNLIYKEVKLPNVDLSVRMVEFSNKHTLGITELEILENLKLAVSSIIDAELHIDDIHLNESTLMTHHHDLTIIHFSDISNIESRLTDPCGGASRFLTVAKRY
jgi:protein arginine kinase